MSRYTPEQVATINEYLEAYGRVRERVRPREPHPLQSEARRQPIIDAKAYREADRLIAADPEFTPFERTVEHQRLMRQALLATAACRAAFVKVEE